MSFTYRNKGYNSEEISHILYNITSKNEHLVESFFTGKLTTVNGVTYTIYKLLGKLPPFKSKIDPAKVHAHFFNIIDKGVKNIGVLNKTKRFTADIEVAFNILKEEAEKFYGNRRAEKVSSTQYSKGKKLNSDKDIAERGDIQAVINYSSKMEGMGYFGGLLLQEIQEPSQTDLSLAADGSQRKSFTQ